MCYSHSQISVVILSMNKEEQTLTVIFVIKNWTIVYCNSSVLIGLAAMVYESLYHTREMVTIKLPSGCSNKAKSAKFSNTMYLLMIFNKTIIPLALVGYEMNKANLALRASLAIYHLISNARSWSNC